jgi:hypothetical protein
MVDAGEWKRADFQEAAKPDEKLQRIADDVARGGRPLEQAEREQQRTTGPAPDMPPAVTLTELEWGIVCTAMRAKIAVMQAEGTRPAWHTDVLEKIERQVGR